MSIFVNFCRLVDPEDGMGKRSDFMFVERRSKNTQKMIGSNGFHRLERGISYGSASFGSSSGLGENVEINRI